jgi:hypothetical protein
LIAYGAKNILDPVLDAITAEAQNVSFSDSKALKNVHFVK